MKIIFFTLIFSLGIIFIPNVQADESSIPSWIKSTAEFWINGDVSDKEFVRALQFLVEQGTITIPQSQILIESSQPESKPMACTLDYRPVCSIDGITYGNLCALESQGSDFSYHGECTDKKNLGKVLFQNVDIFDGENETLQENMNVLVDGNKIKSISSGSIDSDRNTLVIDGDGKTLMPGLIDIHTHMAFVKDIREVEKMAPDEVAIRTQIAAEAWLMDGYTTVRDLGGPVIGLKRTIDAGDVVGPRIFPSGVMLSQTSGHGDWREINDPNPSLTGIRTSNLERMGFFWIADGVPDVLAATRQNLMQGATQTKIMAGGGGSSSYDPIDTCQFTPEELKAIVSATKDWNTYVTAHTFQPNCMQELIEFGVMGLDHAFMLDDETAKIASKKGVWVLPQMNGVSHYLLENPNLPKDKVGIIKKLQENAQTMVDAVKKHNVNIAFATDALGTLEDASKQRHYSLYIHAEYFGNYKTLVHATSMGAKLVEMSGPRNNYDGKLGIIQEEALADILLVDGNPLENLSIIGANPKWYDAQYSPGVDTINIIMKDGVIYKNSLN